ncbi:MAG: hypothetical protein GY839_10065 [candidate division Zixibacteria bacterium]|nr:hypothetical protein [candidate division Zixibacteria bacterium]
MKELKYQVIPLITILISFLLCSTADYLLIGGKNILFEYPFFICLFFIGLSVLLLFLGRWRLKRLNDRFNDSKANWDKWEILGKFQYVIFRNFHIALIISTIGFLAVFSLEKYGMNRQPSFLRLCYWLSWPFFTFQISNYYNWMYHEKIKSKQET